MPADAIAIDSRRTRLRTYGRAGISPVEFGISKPELWLIYGEPKGADAEDRHADRRPNAAALRSSSRITATSPLARGWPRRRTLSTAHSCRSTGAARLTRRMTWLAVGAANVEAQTKSAPG